MDRPPHHPRAAPAVGLHLGDDAVRVARLELDDRGRPRLADWLAIPLPAGCVVEGLARQAGRLPAGVVPALARFVGGDPVRVALASADAVAVPLGAGRADPVGAAADRMPGGHDAGDAVWADVLTVLDRPVSLVAARRSTILRTVEALGRAGLRPYSIEGAPAALAALALALLPLPAPAWTLHAASGRLTWHVTVGRGLRLEGGARTAGVTCAAHALGVRAAGHAPGAPADSLAALRRALGRRGRALGDADAVPLAFAVGAALGGFAGPVGSPDLAAAVVVRPLHPAADPLPRWAVEPLDGADERGPARRAVRTRRVTR